MKPRHRLPEWLTRPLADPSETRTVRRTVSVRGLNTVCDEARCPNRGECFSSGTATFMILGDRCTRNCRFCAVEHGEPVESDPGEPLRVADAARELGLDFVVVTSVTRDDLPDGGAGQFAATIRAVKGASAAIGVEVLVPDFLGDRRSVETVLEAGPQVFGHNVETVSRLHERVRPGAVYGRSLDVLAWASENSVHAAVKSGLMLGLGETRDELLSTLRELRDCGVEILFLGQYLSPSQSHVPVERFVTPEEFEEMANIARTMGFGWVSSGPLVRSSYRAREAAEAVAEAALERSDGASLDRRRLHRKEPQ